MATDATGTPTSPDNIPTFNTAVDAPSGLGSNAQMAAIQTALSSRVTIPASLAATEIPVWNGSAWVRSSTTQVGPASLGTGTPSNQNFLRGDGVWEKGGMSLLYDSTDSGVSFPAASITTPTLDASFDTLLIIMRARSNNATLGTNVQVQFNSDTTANYNIETVRGQAGTAPTSAENLNSSSGYLFDVAGANAEASAIGQAITLIHGYTNTGIRKQWITLFGNAQQASSGTSAFLQAGIATGHWGGTSVLQTIKFFPSLGSFNTANDTRISIYGIPG